MLHTKISPEQEKAYRQSNVVSAAGAITISLMPHLAQHIADVMSMTLIEGDIDKLAKISPIAAARLVLVQQIREATK
jgi:hypothetical protein